jgi:hypothetical protein
LVLHRWDKGKRTEGDDTWVRSGQGEDGTVEFSEQAQAQPAILWLQLKPEVTYSLRRPDWRQTKTSESENTDQLAQGAEEVKLSRAGVASSLPFEVNARKTGGPFSNLFCWDWKIYLVILDAYLREV